MAATKDGKRKCMSCLHSACVGIQKMRTSVVACVYAHVHELAALISYGGAQLRHLWWHRG